MADAALDLIAALVLEDGRRWGEAAVDVQWEDARAVLDEDTPTPYHWLGRARGYSKTTDLAGMAVAVLLSQAPSRGRAYGLAADQAQGALLLDAIGGFASERPSCTARSCFRSSASSPPARRRRSRSSPPTLPQFGASARTSLSSTS